MNTYKLFANNTEEYNVVKASLQNIKNVCGVLVRCNFISAQETVHYAQIAGFEPDVNDKGEKTFTFDKNLDKEGYYKEIMPVLFKEKPEFTEQADLAVLKDALNFFFTSFGEHTHVHIRCLSLYQSIQNLPSLMNTVKELTNTKTES